MRCTKKKTCKCEKIKKICICVVAVIGVIAAIAAIAYAVYKFFAPEYLEDFDDIYDDEFEDDIIFDRPDKEPQVVEKKTPAAEELVEMAEDMGEE